MPYFPSSSATDATLSVSDIVDNNVSSTKHGFAPKSSATAVAFLNAATTPAYAQVKDSDLSLSDITYNNVSTTLHGFAPKAPGGTTQFLRADAAWAAPAGGSDPWTYVLLANDFNTSNSTATAINGMFFAPAINSNYEWEGKFMVRTVTATVAPRIGVRWATAMVAAVVRLAVTSAAATQVLQLGNGSAAVLTPVGGLQVVNIPYPAFLEGQIITNGNVTGSVTIMLASETAGTQVRMVKGSFIRYRTYS